MEVSKIIILVRSDKRTRLTLPFFAGFGSISANLSAFQPFDSPGPFLKLDLGHIKRKPCGVDKQLGLYMFWYRFNRFDRILILSSAIGLILSTFFIFEDRWIYKLLANDDQKLEKIGSVKTAVNDVRQRHADAFAWLPLEAENEVYQGDSIFTGSRSEALIVTDRGERISISPNSLVVINAKTDSIRLDIDYGSVLGEVGKDKKLLIASGGDVTEFKGDDAVVKVDVNRDQNLVVNVIEGQVEVTSDEGRRTLGPKEKAEISDAGTIVEPSDIRIELLTPVPERILKPDESRELILTWRSNYQFNEYTIEISRDPEFSKLILKDKSTRPLYRPPVLPTNERIFWRVSAHLKPNQSPAKSAVAGFTLAEDKPPLVVFPRDNMRLAFEEQPIDDGHHLFINMRWQPRSVSSKWEIHLSASPDFSQNLKIFESKDNFVNLGGLPEGNYYTRLRAKDWADASWSETISFTVSRKSPATLRPPQVLTAEEDFLLTTKFEGYTAIELSEAPPNKLDAYVEAIPELAWNNIPGAVSYEVEIALDRDFTKIVQRAEAANSRYGWSGVRVGSFYWRIRSISTGNRKGPFTEPQPLRIRLAPPKSLINEKVVEEVAVLTQMESAPPPFLLRWSPTLFTVRYEVEFDKDPKFSKPLKVITPYPFKKVQAPVAGLYHWRVRSLNSAGKPLTDWSEPKRYDYARVYLSPETTKELKALYPNNETIMLIGRGEIKIHFRWVTPIKNGRYRFQMSHTKDFQKTRLDFVTDKDFFLFREALPDGWFYWRLRVETAQFTSPWTAPYQFQIQHEFSPFNFERSEQRQEQEIKQFEEKRAKEMAEYQRQNKANAAELARLELESLPQLETPTDLTTSENFLLEARPLSSSQRELEQIPDREQFALLKDLPVLEWHASTNATEYRIEIAEDALFKKIVESNKVSRPSHRWLTARPGRFFWRVQASARGHRPSAYSELAQFELGVQLPSISTPHAVMASLVNQKKAVLLKWASVPFAHSYEVHWSETPDFTQKISNTVTAARFYQTLQKDGLYFWRFRSLNAQKQPLHDFTAARPVNVSLSGRLPASKTPILIFPANGQVLHVPPNEVPRIAFSWQSPPIKGQFVVELAKDKDFNEIVQRLSTKSTTLLMDAPPSGGELFWRVETTSRGRITWRSPASHIKFVNIGSKQSAAHQKIPAKTAPRRAK